MSDKQYETAAVNLTGSAPDEYQEISYFAWKRGSGAPGRAEPRPAEDPAPRRSASASMLL